ncbi:hypothetical protein B0H14DRAFT_2607976 [Mycena olivaceomarginata]|nr:hypothetical protein B0H14DRAFT_2607976 [Mycena olivaceomarginata]
MRLDFILFRGNAIVIAGTRLAIIGLTWGRVRYLWASVDVLAPPVIGLFLLVLFAVYETKACFGVSPIRSAVNSLPGSLITPPLTLSGGVLFSAPIFPLLAPLPPTCAGSALAMFSFTRAFSQTWGITISSTILQNSLKNLPSVFVAQFPPGFEIVDAAIPVSVCGHALDGRDVFQIWLVTTSTLSKKM